MHDEDQGGSFFLGMVIGAMTMSLLGLIAYFFYALASAC